MWQTIERARRRLGGGASASNAGAGGAPAVDTADGGPTDLTFALRRPDLERLIGALADGSTPANRPDTPARLEAALGRAIETAAGVGTPTVTRRPAGLYTPETWHIEIARADHRARTAINRAIRGGDPA